MTLTTTAEFLTVLLAADPQQPNQAVDLVRLSTWEGIANGTSAPQFGDLIVFSESGGPGHVGVVVSVSNGRLNFVGEPVLRPGRGADSNQLIELGEPGR